MLTASNFWKRSFMDVIPAFHRGERFKLISFLVFNIKDADRDGHCSLRVSVNMTDRYQKKKKKTEATTFNKKSWRLNHQAVISNQQMAILASNFSGDDCQLLRI